MKEPGECKGQCDICPQRPTFTEAELDAAWAKEEQRLGLVKSNGGATSYYDFPEGSRTLNDLIEHKNMSFALGNIFKACYRFGEKDGAAKLYDLNKIIYFAERLKAQLKENQ